MPWRLTGEDACNSSFWDGSLDEEAGTGVPRVPPEEALARVLPGLRARRGARVLREAAVSAGALAVVSMAVALEADLVEAALAAAVPAAAGAGAASE